MKQDLTPHRRAVASLLCATALFAIPAFAQDAQTAAPQAAAPQTVTPPPVVPTVSAPPAQTQGAAPATSNPKGIGDPNSATPIAPEAIQSAQESQAANRAASKPKAATTQRVTSEHATTRHSVAERAAPAPQPAPAHVQQTPAPVAATPPVTQPAPPPAPVANTAPAASQADSSTTTTTATTNQGNPILPWAIGGIVVLLGLIALFALRRRKTDRYERVEPAYAAPVAEPIVDYTPEPVAAAPVAEPEPSRFVPAAAAGLGPVTTEEPTVIEEAVASPAAPESVELAKPEAAEVASLTEGDAPVADRPWLELAMRPLRAGTNVDEALVEIELTVGNAGNIAAEDVRISTFMLSADPGSASQMEKLLVQHREDAGVPVDTIAPGEGKRIDATLALLKSEFVAPEDMHDAAFQPMVVAEARYNLPDGSEGRTSASFLIGMHDEEGGGFEPFSLARPEMHEDVEARLAGEPVHA